MDLKTMVLVILMIVFGIGVEGGGGLRYNFYENSCPQLENIVRAGLLPISLTDPTLPASLLRLMFHDCQVQGCDASILVDPVEDRNVTSEMASEKNFGIRRREIISMLKTMVEAACPKQVSCADILVLAAREAVAISGGPQIKIPLGRRDSSVPPSYELADALIPPATAGVDNMLHIFTSKGMTTKESVAIMGAHTLGVTHCLNILERLYDHEGDKDQGMEPRFEAFLKLYCPKGSLTSNSSFVLNDPTTLMFDNQYYMNAMEGRGLLRIDAEMVMNTQTARIMERFATDQDAFFRAFSTAFVKLSTSGVLIEDQGVIRESCNVID
ncbi:peroxidase 29 [Juglans microcarpa x Juglans regia]|uniref:peroxidase 29 n=1 Tax=Juglans microcarpa x Juglans regia TaxID=2249226 RepID=UPI001B7F5283|nr:peroxidase 29 [Juglans microcarpa x Juglans regia]